jgi:Dolichyl-phosphate-mannose-protein mannosyltransferase
MMPVRPVLHSDDGAPIGRRIGQERTVGSVVALATLIAIAVAWNVWWVANYRRGLPFDIDEAGYLQRSLADAASLHSGGIGAFVAHLHNPDPQAPMLPAIAAVVRRTIGVGPIGMIVCQQIFYVLLVVSTWCVARRLGGYAQALVASGLVASTPGILDASRTFGFGLVAVALLTAAVSTQLWAGTFDRPWRVVAWGAVLGLASLSRTMVDGLLPGLVLAAVLRCWALGFDRRRVVNLKRFV